MQPVSIPRINEDEVPKIPQILVRNLYRKDDPTKVVAHETVDAIPGIIIERCGKRYQLQKDGSQRRVG